MRDALPLYDRLQEELVRASVGVAARRVLDLGAGTGETSRRCLDAHPSASVVAIDASQDMLDVAATVLGDRGVVRLGRLEDALPQGPFDLVISALAIHHLDSDGKAELFRRIRACLTPSGRFLMADVIVPDAAVTNPAPLDPTVDKPDRLDDLVVSLGRAGLQSEVRWAEQDLVVVAAWPARA
jgi:tRNA (cmo5U34)-methyltransferase